ncbi:MAG: CPBP family glutamic-type intramembrane protease [Acidobacteriota bacterium]
MQTPLENPEQVDSIHEWSRRLLAVPELLLVVLAGPLLVQFAFVLTHSDVMGSSWTVVVFMASEATLALILIVFLLHRRCESLSQLGWAWENIGQEVGWGFACVPVLFFSTIVVNIFFQAFLPQYITADNPLLDLIQDPGDLALFLFSSLYVGGIKEEIQRAFVLDRFERYLGAILLWPFLPFMSWSNSCSERVARRLGVVVGLILWSIFFAAGHAVQGVDKAAGAGVLGLLFGLLYLWRRNLIAPMVAHTLFDVTALLVVWFS